MAQQKTAKKREANAFVKFFNFKKVSDATKIHPDKLYNNFKGFYNSLDEEDKKLIAKTLSPQVEELFKFLGYKVKIDKA